MVMITVAWGSSFVVTKDTLDTLPASLLAALRSWIAVLSLLWVRPQKSALVPGLWLGLIASVGFVALLTGLTSTTASKAAFIFALNALAAPLLSYWFFKHRVPRRAYLAILIALLGLGVMTLTGQSGVNPGDLWSFAGALCFGFYIAYVGEVAQKASPLSLVQVQYGVMTLVMTIWALPHLSTLPTLSLNVWLVVLYLGIIWSLPNVLQIWAQRVVPSYLAALLFILEPVFASLFAFALLGERLSGLDWLGAALIFAALILCTLPLARKVTEVEQKTV
jgi:drug/metabolite transporter (DMT)-like permease